MNITRVELPRAVEHVMLSQWHDYILFSDSVWLNVPEFFAAAGWDVGYDSEKTCYTLPESQLTFFLLSL